MAITAPHSVPTTAACTSRTASLSRATAEPARTASTDRAQVRSAPVEVWLSTVDQKNLLSRQADIATSAGKPNDAAPYAIRIDPSQRFQQMDGFGASITDSSASLLQKRLSPAARDEVMRNVFGRDGIHASMVRQPMGSCDYNINLFTYDDRNDEDDDFSIDMDRRFMLPTLQEAIAHNPDLKVIASPWSAPGWMKTSGSIIGGSLKPEYYRTYGEYFAKFIEAYRDENINIYAVTPQNEPLYTPAHYPGMSLPAADEAAFIKQGLGPALRDHQLDTKILAYDHNFDVPEYPNSILDDPEAAQYVAGVAWHGYGGSPEVMSMVHDRHPDKGAWFTENSGGEWIPGFHDAFMNQTRNIVRVPRNHGKSVFWWNLALDKEHGPSLLGDWSDCRGLITVDAQNGKVDYNVDYYTLGHLSKFVEPGATRIGSNTYEDEVEDVAFENPDGSRVLVVSNRTAEEKRVRIDDGATSFDYVLAPEAAATFKWSLSAPASRPTK